MSRLFNSAVGLIEIALGTMPPAVTQVQQLLARGTPLRLADAFRLRSVSTDPIPDSAFALPGPVLTRAQLTARLPQPPVPAAGGAARGPAPDAAAAGGGGAAALGAASSRALPARRLMVRQRTCRLRQSRFESSGHPFFSSSGRRRRGGIRGRRTRAPCSRAAAADRGAGRIRRPSCRRSARPARRHGRVCRIQRPRAI